eukprot:COSAG02_NODE_13434_length_1395_cov_7.465278_2_plen_64_part_00
MVQPFGQAANHGQGVGFKVVGLVLTKKMLTIILLELIAGVLFIAPVMWSNSAMATAEDSGSFN